MNATLSAAFDAQMQMGEVHVSAGRPEEAYACFERAHVLGQWHLKAHLRAHLGLLRVGWRSRDSREIWGQCLRLAAALVATPVGWLPALYARISLPNCLARWFSIPSARTLRAELWVQRMRTLVVMIFRSKKPKAK